jgi:hypothetical protein
VGQVLQSGISAFRRDCVIAMPDRFGSVSGMSPAMVVTSTQFSAIRLAGPNAGLLNLQQIVQGALK